MQIMVDGRYVDVTERQCPTYACFRPGHYTHRTSCGASGCSSRTDESLSCLTWYEHGCPLIRVLAGPNRFHAASCTGARWPYRIRTALSNSWIRCLACKQRIPRSVAQAEQMTKEGK